MGIQRKAKAALLTCAAAAALAVPVSPVSLAADSCPDTAVFELDGHTVGESLANWNNSAFNADPPAGWQIVQVPYYAGIFPVQDRRPLDESIADGTAKLEQAVREFRAACGQSRLVLAGYSEGAVVAGDVLERFARSGEIPHDQINGVLYGNPKRAFGDGGTGGVAGGIQTNMPTVLPGVTMLGEHDFGDLAVHDICNENDGICNSANMITNLAAFANGLEGYDKGDHGYDLNPARDLGSGRTLYRQPPRISYGPPLPIPVGTPWQIQQQWRDDPAARQALVSARDGLTGLLAPETVDRLRANSPWFRLFYSA